MTAPNEPSAPIRPTLAFMTARFPHAVALGFGSGLSPRAPGTVGTLWGWAAFLVIDRLFSPTDVGWAALIGGAFLLGWWASTTTAQRAGVADPGFIVIDEIVAFWLVLWLAMPMGLWGQLAAFGLFRFFDSVKLGPVAWADRTFKGYGWRGGWGIMFDDLVAAFCTLLLISVWRF